MDDTQFDNYQTRVIRTWINENKSLYLNIEDMNKDSSDIYSFADKLYQLFIDLYKPTPQMGGKYVASTYTMYNTIVNWVQVAQSFRDDLIAKKF